VKPFSSFVVVCALLASAIPAMTAENPLVLPLWDGPPPNPQPHGASPVRVAEGNITWVRHVRDPQIEVRLPSRGAATGQAVVVCPGGGYGGLAYDWEGTDIAGWLNSRGIAAIVLTYRLPADGAVEHRKWLTPLLDAQRAIRTTRANAEAWGIDPTRVGIMGFSAGGHLASTAGTKFDDGDSASADPVERFGSRPDFMILIYPVVTMGQTTHGGSKANLLGKDPDEELARRYSNELHVTRATPPTFLLHSGDDGAVPVRNSLLFYEALLEHGVSAELHVYPYGGHGYSLAVGRGRLQHWTELCARWMSEL
jgi:acetyl esterase/lipase